MFQIFVVGDSRRSEAAVDNLRELCAGALGGEAEIEVVDVLLNPERAEEQRILATPTVLRVSPPPTRRVIGDLTDFALAAKALGLPPVES